MSALLRAMVAVVANASSPITVDGDLSASGSTSTVTGTTRTVSVPAGNSGDIRFDALTIGNTGSMQYSKNGSAFTSGVITEDLIVNFADSDTVAIRSAGLTSPETDTVVLINNDTGAAIATYGTATISRT